jgi:hypothetical protein
MATSIKSAWPQVVGQAWADEEFRRRLLANPKGVLDELGVEVPAGHRIELVEDTPAQTFLVMPRKPEHLESLASASGSSLGQPFKADACTPEPAFACTPAPAFACTPEPAFACTPKPDACTPRPADACTPKPADACTPKPAFACTPEPAFACTPEPRK